MRPSARRSLAWDHFKKINDTNVSCNICKKQLKFSGNTSNLNDHLRRRHVSYIASKNEETSTFDQIINCDTNANLESPSSTLSSSHLVSSTSIPVVPIQKQVQKRTFQTKLIVSDKHAQLSEKQKESIDFSLIKMIVTDLQPLSLVENKGFLEYSKKLQPLYKVPDRKLLSNNMLTTKYDEIKNRLHNILKEVSYVAITTDMWTSDGNKAFLSLTSHFIFQNKLTSAVLCTKEVHENHTSNNIASTILNILEEWNISEKIVTIVSDNGANIKKAIIENLQMRHHPCIAHTLNLCINDTIKSNPDFCNLLSKCRLLVGHFKHSITATEKLRNMQKQMGLSELKVKQDISTRWNSCLKMIERLFEIKQPLSAIITSLPNAPEFLSAYEWEIIDDCIPILKPVEWMTTELSAEKYPTMSYIIPMIRGLQYTIVNIQTKTSCADNIKKYLLDAISRRLGILECDRTCAKATFLDPRFKKVPFVNETNAINAQKWISNEVQFLSQQKTSIISTSSNQKDNISTRNQSTTTCPLWSVIDQKISEVKAVYRNAPIISANLSVEQYLRSDYLERLEDPLQYWKNNVNQFPELYKLSLKYLCIPATSVPSERLFSKAGQIINDRRNRLTGEKLNKIIFLNSNLEIK